MTLLVTLRGAALAAALALSAPAAAAQDTRTHTTADEMRAEISQAMEAIATYSVQERDRALADARQALDRLDAEIEQREQALRETWAEMSEAARETARARLQDLRKARNRLGERYGALETGASSAWDELRTGFSDAWIAFSGAWTAFSGAWTAADDEVPAN